MADLFFLGNNDKRYQEKAYGDRCKLGLAAGAMIWMVLSELLPDAFKDAKKERVATIATLSVALMVMFQVLMDGR